MFYSLLIYIHPLHALTIYGKYDFYNLFQKQKNLFHLLHISLGFVNENNVASVKTEILSLFIL